MGDLHADLARDAELIETHISWVFLSKQSVLKVKKPVNLGFLDFSTLEQRRVACDRELELNRRLTHDVYREVVPITRDARGMHRVDGQGQVVDYGVVMRRLSDSGRADQLLATGALGVRHVRCLAEKLASFHSEALRSSTIDSAGDLSTVEFNVRENFEQTREAALRYVSEEQEQAIEQQQLEFIANNGGLFKQRIADGKICDGHGDLRLEHVYFSDDQIDIIDCIEFNDRFRHGDVCADVAFLAMDLTHSGHAALGEDFLAAYARAAGDFDLFALVDFYMAYRATVRAKVASILAGSSDASTTARADADRRARAYYMQAMLSQRPTARNAVVVAVGGLIASGKSTTAERISALLHCPVVDSDRTRKQLLGHSEQHALSDAAFRGAYAPEVTHEVYSELLRRGSIVLASGRPLVLDASFGSPERREAARTLAADFGVPFQFVQCTASREETMRRLEKRAQRPHVSDGRADIYDEFASHWQPPNELPGDEVSTLDTCMADADVGRELRAICARFCDSDE